MSGAFSSQLARLSWLLYEFANHPFSVVVVIFVYPVDFKRFASLGFAEMGDLLWGISGSVSTFRVALVSPVLGAAADL